MEAYFQNNNESKKARKKEIVENEKKNIATAKLANEHEVLKLSSLLTSAGSSAISSVEQEALVQPSSTLCSSTTTTTTMTMKTNVTDNEEKNKCSKTEVENTCDSIKNDRTKLKPDESSQVKEIECTIPSRLITNKNTTSTTEETRIASTSAVVSLPNTQNLNKLNLMNEPLIFPLRNQSSCGSATHSANSNRNETMTPVLRKSVLTSMFQVNAAINAISYYIRLRK